MNHNENNDDLKIYTPLKNGVTRITYVQLKFLADSRFFLKNILFLI